MDLAAFIVEWGRRKKRKERKEKKRKEKKRSIFSHLGHVQPLDSRSSAESRIAYTDKCIDNSYNP
jgi:hypothetical protein